METHGNPELSLEIGKCNDYPEREYTQASGSGGCLNNWLSKFIVSSFTHIAKGDTMNRKKIPEYNIWKGMRARCNSSCNKNVGSYQSVGIVVCERWNDFNLFLSDMGSRPSSKHSIDRIDNSKGYSPENCRWATQDVQCKNRGSFNKIFIYNGEAKVLKDWAKHFNIKYTTLYQRIYREGLNFEEAISKRNNKLGSFELNGVIKTLKEWSSDYNMPYKTVTDRVCGKKWSLIDALSKPIKR